VIIPAVSALLHNFSEMLICVMTPLIKLDKSASERYNNLDQESINLLMNAEEQHSEKSF